MLKDAIPLKISGGLPLSVVRPLEAPGPHGECWEARDTEGRRMVLRILPGMAGAAGRAGGPPPHLCFPPPPGGTFRLLAQGSDLLILRPWVQGRTPHPGDPASLAAAALALARLLDLMHSAGLVHGNPGRGNVVETPEGALVLLDGGLAALDGTAASAGHDVSTACRWLLDTPAARATGPEARALCRLLRRAVRRPPTAADLAERLSRLRGGQQRTGGYRVVATGTGAAVAVVGLLWAVTGRSHHRVHPLGPGSRAAVVMAPSEPPVTGCPDAVLTGPTGARVGARIDGGCPVPWAWSGGRLRTVVDGRAVTYRLGRPGDVLLTGRWGCSAGDLPAIYRPDTGQVFYFGSWAGPRRPVASRPAVSSGIVGGRPVVAGGRCQTVRVVRAG